MILLCINWSDPSIIAAIISGLCTIAVAIGTGLLFWKKRSIELDFENKKNEYQLELDNKGREIQNQLDTKLEVMKLQLSSLQEKRLDAIMDVSCELNNLYSSVMQLTSKLKLSAWGTDDEIKERIISSYTLLVESWKKCQILFPAEIAKNMNMFLINAYNSSDNHFFWLNQTPVDWGMIHKLSDEVSKTLPPLIETIEQSIRELLGVETK